MLMRFSDSTTGVKFSVMPYGLYSTPIWQVRIPSALVQSWLFGIGISPPAVNVADSPETATRVGSASTRDTPARSKACSVPVALKLPLLIEPEKTLLDASTCGAIGNTASVAHLNADQLPDVLIPSCFTTERATSTT